MLLHSSNRNIFDFMCSDGELRKTTPHNTIHPAPDESEWNKKGYYEKSN